MCAYKLVLWAEVVVGQVTGYQACGCAFENFADGTAQSQEGEQWLCWVGKHARAVK